ncbi:MAG: ABC transporter ATP-binding protein [Patescibacteria group bacterium]
MTPETITATHSQTRKGLSAIWRHLQPFKGKLVVIFILGMISALANGSVPYVTGKFFDALIGVAEHKNVAQIWTLSPWAFLLVLWIVAQFIANNVDWINDRIRRKVGITLQFNIQSNGFKHMFKLPLGYHKNGHINGEMNKISQASWRIQSIFETFVTIAPQLLSIIIGIVLAASINTILASVLIVGVLLYVILLVYILHPIAQIDSLGHKAWNDSWEDAASSVQQIESVKQAASEEHESEKVDKSFLGTALALWKKLEMTWSSVAFFQRTVVFLTQLAIFAISVSLVTKGIITVGQLVALNGYAMMFFGPFVALGSSWQTIRNGIIAASNLEEIFDTKPEIYKPHDMVTVDTISGNIVFDHVNFRYTPDGQNILSDISINVHPGEVVAVVGESGVGKSTAISLISGYYFPTEGSVTIDGVDTRKLDLTFLRQHIAIVPQEVALFNDTIKVNIEYGSFGASDTDVKRVAKEAHMEEFIESMPNKYETIVGERGVKLSVGQKQRVSIARAILRNPAILILDEPTSALDARTEQIVTESLEKLMKGRTTFIIAHRLSTVRKADRILVFEKGRIVENGSHTELIKIEAGVYRKLYEYQIGLH